MAFNIDDKSMQNTVNAVGSVVLEQNSNILQASPQEMTEMLKQSRQEAEKKVSKVVTSNTKVTFVGQQVRGKFYPPSASETPLASFNQASNKLQTSSMSNVKDAPAVEVKVSHAYSHTITTSSAPPQKMTMTGSELDPMANDFAALQALSQISGQMPSSSVGSSSAVSGTANISPANKLSNIVDSIMTNTECQTCANRTYQDGSDDPSVSFQTPTRIAPAAVANAVRSHESEHVRNESNKAARENKKIVMQSVQIHTSVCPECGKVYVSGGTTTTVTQNQNDQSTEQTQTKTDPSTKPLDTAAA